MKKQERMNAAKAAAKAIECKASKKKQAEALAAVSEFGGTLKPDTKGFGFWFRDSDKSRYHIHVTFSPNRTRVYAPTYKESDWRAYNRASEALSRGDLDKASKIADKLPKVLANEVNLGVEKLWREQEEAKAAKNSPRRFERIEDPVAQFEAICEFEKGAESRGIRISATKTCIWVSGNTYLNRMELKSMGFKWAPKKKAWYWKVPTQKAA